MNLRHPERAEGGRERVSECGASEWEREEERETVRKTDGQSETQLEKERGARMSVGEGRRDTGKQGGRGMRD